jgi:alkylhydroperoxidase family enzyme
LRLLQEIHELDESTGKWITHTATLTDEEKAKMEAAAKAASRPAGTKRFSSAKERKEFLAAQKEGGWA